VAPASTAFDLRSRPPHAAQFTSRLENEKKRIGSDHHPVVEAEIDALANDRRKPIDKHLARPGRATLARPPDAPGGGRTVAAERPGNQSSDPGPCRRMATRCRRKRRPRIDSGRGHRL